MLACSLVNYKNSKENSQKQPLNLEIFAVDDSESQNHLFFFSQTDSEPCKNHRALPRAAQSAAPTAQPGLWEEPGALDGDSPAPTDPSRSRPRLAASEERG